MLEKYPKVGGILASYQKRGFKIDQGSHLISRGRHGAIGQALKALGLARPRVLPHRIPVRSRGIFHATAPPSILGLPAVAVQGARDLGLPVADALRLAAMLAGEAIRVLRMVLRDDSLSYVEGGMDALPHVLLEGGRCRRRDRHRRPGHPPAPDGRGPRGGHRGRRHGDGPTVDDPEDGPEVWKEKGLAALAQVIPGLMDHLVFADQVSVPAAARWMGRPSRGAIATGQQPGQAAHGVLAARVR